MGLENLQLFFRFSNVCGLFPFRLVLDEQTGRFERLVGKWRHSANWWFTLLLIGQVYFIILDVVCTAMVNGKLFLDGHKSFSVVLILTVALELLNFTIITLVPRLFLFRIRNLEIVLEHLGDIDRILTRIVPKPLSCTSRQRTIVGISIISLYTVSEKMEFGISKNQFEK
jgi:hypothetical protein